MTRTQDPKITRIHWEKVKQTTIENILEAKLSLEIQRGLLRQADFEIAQYKKDKRPKRKVDKVIG